MKPVIASINLRAIQENWAKLSNMSKAKCSAVVKANAYGLGAKKITSALHEKGCRIFFVAYLKEALEIKPFASNSEIYILNGIDIEEFEICIKNNFTPVINTLDNLHDIVNSNMKSITIALHFDTGMNRLGIPSNQASQVSNIIKSNEKIELKLVMSHIACAEDRDHNLNRQQLNLFNTIKDSFPKTPCSLANSSSIFLDKAYHFDILRPGYALYGGNPTPYSKTNPMQEVLSIHSDIIQLREIRKGQTIGYNATWKALRKSLIATIPYGYADGLLRLESNNSQFYIDKYPTPIVGSISMDMTTIDVTDVPKSVLNTTPVTLLGKEIKLEELANNAQTIGYELLTHVGRRLKKQYNK